ncbi:hypothetical protein DdX_06941 [Ditylenchus destructor]|uniref:Uncharacterized protein n=1 Tax=Ditylenchus destructor TaxID=166010 RepID=A0AAD4N6G6_9BILA|nr:hypothetical protein DdX_06941 [Ditylenchus destructor]
MSALPLAFPLGYKSGDFVYFSIKLFSSFSRAIFSLSELLAFVFSKLRQSTMGAAVVLLLVVAIAAGAAYHLGYLDVYIEQAKQKINEAQQKQQ